MTPKVTSDTDLKIAAAPRADYRAISEMIVAECRHPSRQCIHSWTRGSVGSVTEAIRRLVDKGEMLLVEARVDGRLVGMIAAEYDVDERRAWLWGPFVRESHRWETIAKRLLAEVEQGLPDIDGFRVAVNEHNDRAQRLYQRRGFGGRRSFALYRLEGAVPEHGNPVHLVEPLSSGFHDRFRWLHDQLFPTAYFKGSAIIKQLDAQHRVFVAREGSSVLGYIYASKEGDTGEVEFVGVEPTQRRRGVARDLLYAALDWLCNDCGVKTVELNLAEQHRAAGPLYESVGFQLQYAGVGLRRDP